MKVVMAGSEWFSSRPGGLNRYFESLYSALREAPGVDVTATAFGEPPPGGASWGPPARSTPRRVMSSRSRRATPTPDVLDRHFALYGAHPVRRRLAKVEVVHFHGPWAAESATAGGRRPPVVVKRLIELHRYRAAAHLVVLSDAFRSVLVDDYSIEPDRITVIPPGVDVSRFRPVSSPRADRPIVLCVRRLERRMGIHRLIEAWTMIARSFPDAELHIAGTGTYEPTLREQAAESPSASSIRFVGLLPEGALRSAYAEATVTVVPSVALEGFGLIALESLAAGTPPIVTDCGGLPDAVRGLDPSLVVPADSSADLAERIIDALNGRIPTAAACRSHAELFGWGAVARRHLDLYTGLLEAS